MDDQIEQVQETQEVVEQAAPEPPKIDQKEVERKAEELYQARNFKQLREQAEQVYKRNQELEKLVAQQQKAPSYNIGDDDIVEGKHLGSIKAELKQEIEGMKQELQQQQVLMTENLIRSQCPDFDAIVTPENLQKLSAEYPEIAATLNSSQDLKAKAISAYKLIKKFEIYNPQMSQDKEAISKNLAKPKPSNALPKAESDLSRANAFEQGQTDAEKEARYKQMRNWAKQA